MHINDARNQDLNDAKNQDLNDARNQDLNDARNQDLNDAKNQDLNDARNQDLNDAKNQDLNDAKNQDLMHARILYGCSDKPSAPRKAVRGVRVALTEPRDKRFSCVEDRTLCCGCAEELVAAFWDAFADA